MSQSVEHQPHLHVVGEELGPCRRDRRWTWPGRHASRRSGPTPGDVTAVVSVADDGGSTGRLREAGETLAPGDLRKCLVVLAEPDSLLARAMEFRFDSGELAGPRGWEPDAGGPQARFR